MLSLVVGDVANGGPSKLAAVRPFALPSLPEQVAVRPIRPPLCDRPNSQSGRRWSVTVADRRRFEVESSASGGMQCELEQMTGCSAGGEGG